MMYPFMQLDDGTEIVHSEAFVNGTKEVVKVYFERPILGGFANATCFLPDYLWEDINGFTEAELKSLQEILESTAHLIMRFSRQGGLENAY